MIYGRFIETKYGKFYPLNKILKIEPLNNSPNITKITFEDGLETRIYKNVITVINEINEQISEGK